MTAEVKPSAERQITRSLWRRLNDQGPHGGTKALPQATQVADRRHLIALRKSMRQIRSAVGAASVDPDLLTAAEHIQTLRISAAGDANAAGLVRAQQIV
jgi:hypothetical protein